MPFDTTYYFLNQDNAVKGTLTIPGGNDTTIYLNPGQLPAGIDTMFLAVDSSVSSVYHFLKNESDLVKTHEPYSPGGDFIFLFILIFALIIYSLWKKSEEPDSYSQTIFKDTEKTKKRSFHTYYGDELAFSNQQISVILAKRFSYYKNLSLSQQTVFIERLQKFIADKTFKIHGEKGFKEMPVLIGASAIQLTFGLDKYLLPHFQYIHIHPQEFLRVRPILCFLEGNVSGHSINLSWKHFLDGYANTHDGQNVGLHELAHALHYQNFVVERHVDKGFKSQFDNFHMDGNKAFDTEKTVAGGLYSEYAEKNFQEFWAESVELFFEKPVDMEAHYPGLYKTMKILLKQDPANRIPSMGS